MVAIAFQSDEAGGHQSLKLLCNLLLGHGLHGLFASFLTLFLELRLQVFFRLIDQHGFHQRLGRRDVGQSLFQRTQQAHRILRRIDRARVLEIQRQLAPPLALGQGGLSVEHEFRLAAQQRLHQFQQVVECLRIVELAGGFLLPLFDPGGGGSIQIA